MRIRAEKTNMAPNSREREKEMAEKARRENEGEWKAVFIEESNE